MLCVMRVVKQFGSETGMELLENINFIKKKKKCRNEVPQTWKSLLFPIQMDVLEE